MLFASMTFEDPKVLSMRTCADRSDEINTSSCSACSGDNVALNSLTFSTMFFRSVKTLLQAERR